MMDVDLSLDQIGIVEGTDKSSLVADYLRQYEVLFKDLRGETFNLIEIGVFSGASLRTWIRYFKNAQMIGVDINPACKQYEGERIRIEIGSQDDPEFLHRLATKYPPSIIIDDGSHRSDHNIFTFERLFPALLPGGWYIIEDLHFQYQVHSRGAAPEGPSLNSAQYFNSLCYDVVGGPSHTRQLSGLRRYLAQSIDTATVFGNITLFRKRSSSGDVEAELDAVAPHVQRSQSGRLIFGYADRLTRAKRPPEQVIFWLMKAIERDPTNWLFHVRLSEARALAGDRQGAFEAREQAIALAPSQTDRDRLVLGLEKLKE